MRSRVFICLFPYLIAVYRAHRWWINMPRFKLTLSMAFHTRTQTHIRTIKRNELDIQRWKLCNCVYVTPLAVLAVTVVCAREKAEKCILAFAKCLLLRKSNGRRCCIHTRYTHARSYQPIYCNYLPHSQYVSLCIGCFDIALDQPARW